MKSFEEKLEFEIENRLFPQVIGPPFRAGAVWAKMEVSKSVILELVGLKKFAEMHHHQQPDHEILHGLTIDVPARVDLILEMLGAVENNEVYRAAPAYADMNDADYDGRNDEGSGT